jgi:hypothetical protein
MIARERACPGCGLVMPVSSSSSTHAYCNSSPKCWHVYGEVLADVALCDSVMDHVETSRKWAETVWAAWSEHHHAVAAFAAQYLAED